MNDFENIGKFGVANIPPQSNAQQTATYTTLSWGINTRIGPISMFAKQPASEKSVHFMLLLFNLLGEILNTCCSPYRRI